ncbi:NUDIX hydrolase [Dethiosulfovibrio peptidovorans]|nr:CoA pyrophosphatase [Dethiosulfovibrio peptidovorans]
MEPSPRFSPFSPWETLVGNFEPVRWGAVAIPILSTKAGPRVVSILRPESMRSHGGQIAFPGGAREEGDLTPWETACRETCEEIGLDGKYLKFLGAVPIEDVFVSGFKVIPIVVEVDGAVRESDFVLNEDEVARVILLDPDTLSGSPEMKRGLYRGVEYSYPIYPLCEKMSLWGASARMFRNVDRLGFFRRFRSFE